MSRVAPAGARMVPPAPEKSTKLVLIRHGEAVCNVRGVVGGPLGCTGLSSTGARQAEALRRRLAERGELAAAVALYSSVLPRARDTAMAIASAVGPGDLSLVEDCGLCELHPGEADGLDWEQFTARFTEPAWDDDPSTPIAPGGESWTGFIDRAAGALGEVAARHGGGQVVVVCHAGVIEAAMLRFLPVSGPPRLKLRTAHVSITEFEREGAGGNWRLLRYNDAAHLPG